MAKKKATAPTQVEANVGEIFSRSERFIETYKNYIIYAVIAVVLIVVAILGIRHFYFVPKEKEAQAAIYPGENYFERQQWEVALNGNGVDYIGFLGIIDDYGITKTAKLAKVYAGICYYHLNQPEEALSFLKKADINDNIVSPIIKGIIGDCYVDLGNVEEGIKYFNKAASELNNELSSTYLKKAGRAYEHLKDFDNAIKAYQTIKDKYSPSADEISEIDRYIERSKLQR